MSRSAFFLFVLFTMPLLVGCDGCRPATSPNADSEKDKKAPKEAYSTKPAIVYPSGQSETFGSVKPGHWMTAEQSLRSNNSDTRGDLVSRSSLTLRDSNLDKTGTIESLDTVRPVVLPKGQMRGFDFRFRCPVPNSIDTKRIVMSCRLIPSSGGIMETGGQPFNVMGGSEYFFVILTNRPERFARFQVADWVRSGENQIDYSGGKTNYRVVVPDASHLISLPETMLDMTSIAVVFWDDLSEDALTPMQQSALGDWIRFGGRFIINGPDASEAVANTMLADVLPLLPTSNIELDGEAAAELLRKHSVSTDRSLEKQIKFIASESSRIAIDGQLDKDAIAIDNTASLILSRRIGRGHVIQPRFDLTGNWIESWDSYDSFINSVILNRPPRKYVAPNLNEGEDDADLAAEGFRASELSLFFAGTKKRTDAAVNSRFRIATRDSLLGGGEQSAKRNSPFDDFTRVDAITGISAWTATSDVNMMLRETLASEAGIEIPGSALVIRSLLIYLIVLVPVNYIVFRLMNRLEYAWFAVPVIAVIGAVWAARQARLDIGFARSNTELAVLEAHAGYERAHLTRMVGVYNSLSSRYELQFPTVDGIATPLENEADPNTSVIPSIRNSFEEGMSLVDFAVNSNRMRYVHTEEMIDMGGPISFDGRETLTSESDLELLDGILIRKDKDGETEIAAVGTLAPGESKTVEFRATKRLMVAGGLPMQTSRIIRRFASPNSIPNGSSRLVARIDSSLDGVRISPPASQNTAQTIALIHLQHADLPEPRADDNLIADFRRVNRVNRSGKTQQDTQETNTEKE